MAAPLIEFAYFTPDRDAIIVLCHIDNNYATGSPAWLSWSPLSASTPNNGWTVKKSGVVQTFTATVADPRPNCVTLTLDSPAAYGDSFTVEYDRTTGDTVDAVAQEIQTTSSPIDVDEPIPIIDLIARDFASRLGDVTTAHGFIYTLTVEANINDPQRTREGLALVSYDDPQPEEDAPIMHEQFTAAFHIAITTAVSTALDTPLTAKEYQIEADVMRWLQRDYTRNNLAVDTIPQAPGRVDFGEGGWGGISVNLLVRFRTLYGDRFSQ